MLCRVCGQEKEKVYEKKKICIDCWLQQIDNSFTHHDKEYSTFSIPEYPGVLVDSELANIHK